MYFYYYQYLIINFWITIAFCSSPINIFSYSDVIFQTQEKSFRFLI